MTRLVGPVALAAMWCMAARVAEPLAQAPDRASVLDNSTVGITRLRFPPATREDVHTNLFPVLIVQLTAGQVTVTDREMLRIGSRPGEVWFMPAGTPNAVANRSPSPFDVVKVAIKTGRAPAPASAPTEAPEGIVRTTIVDNGDVRVVRVRFAPNGREPLHTHSNDLLTIQITRGIVEIVNGNERSTFDREPGFVEFVSRNVPHAYASADTKPFELVSVSIK